MPIEIQLRSVQLLQRLIVMVPFQLYLIFSVLLTGFVRLNLVANLSFQICFPLSWSPKVFIRNRFYSDAFAEYCIDPIIYPDWPKMHRWINRVCRGM